MIMPIQIQYLIEKLMIKRRIITILYIVASVLIALCVGFLVWKILELIYPHKSILDVSLDAIVPDYDLPRWAMGSIVFGLLYLYVCYLWDKSLLTQSHKKINVDFPANPLWVGVFSLRIVFSLYFVSFWSNYVFYMWFSNISLMIGGFGNDFYLRQGCVIVASLLGIYIILAEPWQKLITPAFPDSLRMIARVVSVLLISINFYLLSITTFSGNVNIPILITFTFFVLFGFTFIAKDYSKDSRMVNNDSIH
jgi:hypothetical protein